MKCIWCEESICLFLDNIDYWGKRSHSPAAMTWKTYGSQWSIVIIEGWKNLSWWIDLLMAIFEALHAFMHGQSCSLYFHTYFDTFEVKNTSTLVVAWVYREIFIFKAKTSKPNESKIWKSWYHALCLTSIKERFCQIEIF